ncbi:MAG: restriction endonuclease subunit S [Candidatus Reddybacter sp.]
MFEWVDMCLGEFVELKRGYDLPKKNREQGTVPLVSSSGETDFHSVAKVIGPGVVTGRYGTIGQVFYIEKDFWPLNTTLYVKDFKGNDPLFVYYFLKTISYSDYSDKAAVPGINRNHLHKAEVRVPIDPIYQRILAEKLWVLDEKIELNRQTNQTLEHIAQAIFKSWFVDFEPTRAKIAAKQNGQDSDRAAMAAISGKTLEQLDQLSPEQQQQLKTTAALFSDALVDSELGEVPEGWRSGSIGDIATAKGGYAFKGKSFVDTGYPVIKIKNITGDGRVDLTDAACIDADQAKVSERFKLSDGDLLMAMTGATVGKIGLVIVSGQSIYLNQRVAKFESEKFGPKISWFLYCCFGRESIFDAVVSAAQGSAQPNISSSGIESAKLILPSDDLIEAFCQKADPLFNKWMSNINENTILEISRGALLPKLISGEIHVKKVA